MTKSVMDRIEEIEQAADEVAFDVAKETEIAYYAAGTLVDNLRNIGKTAEADAVKAIRDALGYRPTMTFFRQ